MNYKELFKNIISLTDLFYNYENNIKKYYFVNNIDYNIDYEKDIYVQSLIYLQRMHNEINNMITLHKIAIQNIGNDININNIDNITNIDNIDSSR